MAMNTTDCSVESCDMFDFMSNCVGRKILHPGGLKATNKLIELLKINKNHKVLDLACGKGLTSIYLAKKYGCQVVGIDIREKSIGEANYLSKKKGVSHLVSFKVADASKLPFSNNEFDIIVSQAILGLVENKTKVIEEIVRVLKCGGYFGGIEVSWKKQPPVDFLNAAKKTICGICVGNIETYAGWEDLLSKNRLKKMVINKFTMGRSLSEMIRDEGIINGLKIIVTLMTHPKIKKRMMNLFDFFKLNSEYIGYGIYAGEK
jgi:ubiquinone/menaquinone biosynthesis C-methylase UbiE